MQRQQFFHMIALNIFLLYDCQILYTNAFLPKSEIYKDSIDMSLLNYKVLYTSLYEFFFDPLDYYLLAW